MPEKKMLAASWSPLFGKVMSRIGKIPVVIPPKVKVEVKDRRYTVRARRGYVAS